MRLEYQPSGLEADSKDAPGSRVDRFRPGFGVGAPIWKDHLFAYGSVNLSGRTRRSATNLTGALPDSNFDINEYFIKLSATPSTSAPDRRLLPLSRHRPGQHGHRLRLDAHDRRHDEGDRPGRRLLVVLDATPQFNLEAKVNYNDTPNSSSPTVPLPFQPPFDPVNPATVGYYCDPDTGLCDGVEPAAQ